MVIANQLDAERMTSTRLDRTIVTKLLTIDEAAALLRRTPAALRYMRHVGKGPKSALVGGRVMYRADDVDAYIDAAFAETPAA